MRLKVIDVEPNEMALHHFRDDDERYTLHKKISADCPLKTSTPDQYCLGREPLGHGHSPWGCWADGCPRIVEEDE